MFRPSVRPGPASRVVLFCSVWVMAQLAIKLMKLSSPRLWGLHSEMIGSVILRYCNGARSERRLRETPKSAYENGGWSLSGGRPTRNRRTSLKIVGKEKSVVRREGRMVP